MAKRNSKIKKRLFFLDKFYSDINDENMLYGITVRAPFSYGKIISISLDSEETLPENYYLFTAKDIPGVNDINTLDVHKKIFCDEHINYKGEAVGLLVGPDKKILSNLLSKIEIKLDDKELKQNFKKFTEKFDNLKFSIPSSQKIKSVLIKKISERKVETGNIDEVFATADFIVEKEWHNSMHSESNKETEGVICSVKDGNLSVTVPNQWISHLRMALSDVTAIPTEKISITRTNFSAMNTNSLWKNAVIACQAAVAAIKTGKTVKIVYSRDEQIEFIENVADISIYHRTAVSKEGKILGMDVKIRLDGGNNNPIAKEILDRLVIASCGIYCCDNIRIIAESFSSNKSELAVDFTMIDAYAFYAIENQIQKIAEVTGFSPLELKLKNIKNLPSEKNSMPFIFTNEKVKETLEAVCKKSDFHRKNTIYRISETERYKFDNSSPFSPPLRGIGLTCGFEGSGYFGTHFNGQNLSMEVTLQEDGKLSIHSLPPRDSIWNIWQTIVSSTLDIDKKNIILKNNFDESLELEMPETVSSNVTLTSYLLKKCCEYIKNHKNNPLPITVKKSVPATKKKQWNRTKFCGVPFYTTGFAACVLELELDPNTFRENILGIFVVISGGKIMNVKAAELTVKKSIKNILSDIVENEYIKCPNISVQFIQSDEESKQIGHLITSILPAAFTGALSQALARTVSKLPIKTDSIYLLTKAAKKDAELLAEKQKAEEDAKMIEIQKATTSMKQEISISEKDLTEDLK